MATSRGATVTSHTHTAAEGTCTLSHTVDADTTLLVLAIQHLSDASVATYPRWDAAGVDEYLSFYTRVGFNAGSSGYATTWIFYLVSPTAKTANLTISMNDDNVCLTAINYKGTLASWWEAIEVMEYVNNTTASSTTAFASNGIAGQSNIVLGACYGGDMDPASNASGYSEIFDSASGTSTLSDVAGYVADDIGGGVSAVTVSWNGSDENSGLHAVISDTRVTRDLGDFQLQTARSSYNNPRRMGRVGPWKIGSYLYLVGEYKTDYGSSEDRYEAGEGTASYGRSARGTIVNVWRCPVSSDPSVITNWSCPDPEGAHMALDYSLGNWWSTCCIDSHVDGTDIHVIWQDGGQMPQSAEVIHCVYDTSSETWGTNGSITDIRPTHTTQLYGSGLSCSVSTRSDGDVIVLFGDKGDGQIYDTPWYGREESSTWTSEIEVYAAPPLTPFDFGGGSNVMAASDRAHFCWSNNNGNLHVKTLTSTNTLGSLVSVSTNLKNDANATGMARLLADGSVGCPYVDSSNYPCFVTWSNADTPSAVYDRTIDSNAIKVTNQAADNDYPHLAACVDPDNGDIYVVTADADGTGLRYWKSEDDGDTWSSSTEINSATNVLAHSCEIYDNGTNWVLGTVWTHGTPGTQVDSAFVATTLRASSNGNNLLLLGVG